MQPKNILVIGAVYVDTHLDKMVEGGPIVGLGGIFHSARAFSAIGTKYSLAYYAPEYLDADIQHFAKKLNAEDCYKLGNVDKSPNIMLINDSKEIGDQGYYDILKDQAIYVDTASISEIVDLVNPSDILIYPGKYDIKKILDNIETFQGNIYIDFHYDSENILENYSNLFKTIILSTSSSIFTDQCKASHEGILNYFNSYNVETLLIKENRGGSYCYLKTNGKKVEAPAYYVDTSHSVGVGDAYNSVFISDFYPQDIEKRMRLSSLIASKYAATMDFEIFKSNVEDILQKTDEFIELKGIRLSWEDRAKNKIYLAAPDFPDVDTKLLNKLEESLSHHNFQVKRPIKENGLISDNTTFKERLEIYNKDVQLLDDCNILIAALLYNDPGTLVEFGMFKQMEKPVLIFDPYRICNNNFVVHSADFICYSIEEVLDALYNFLGEKL